MAFRLALDETLCAIDEQRHLDIDPDDAAGFLAEVPFLEPVLLPVQVDLLGEVWRRHRRPAPVEASLLDAAVFYATCETAIRIAGEKPKRSLEAAGPRVLIAAIPGYNRPQQTTLGTE